MAGLCKAIIVGNLGADPEKRYTQDGRPVTRFRVAVNTNRRDKDGNWQEQTQWFGVTAFGRQAEMAAERLTKGSRVYVDGRLETRTVDGPDGRRFFMDVLANEVISLDARARAEGDFGTAEGAFEAPFGSEPRPSTPAGRPNPNDAGDLDELPF
ncbi:MAG TPA: single-stranded DNA-binding protein [Chloroflexota bacterium]|nr:single-stranded DNA-binding protein [Chloroflexota bacterium]